MKMKQIWNPLGANLGLGSEERNMAVGRWSLITELKEMERSNSMF